MANDKKDNAAKNTDDAKPDAKEVQAQEEGQGKEDLREQMLRLAAEFDNYKKRAKLEMDRAKDAGKAELASHLLPILDEFELALIAANGSGDKALSKGVELVYSNMYDTLENAGLHEIKAEGVADPYKHEIVMVKESDKKPGTILEVVKKGYTFGDLMLRPASVIVAKDGAKDNKNGK